MKENKNLSRTGLDFDGILRMRARLESEEDSERLRWRKSSIRPDHPIGHAGVLRAGSLSS